MPYTAHRPVSPSSESPVGVPGPRPAPLRRRDGLDGADRERGGIGLEGFPAPISIPASARRTLVVPILPSSSFPCPLAGAATAP